MKERIRSTRRRTDVTWQQTGSGQLQRSSQRWVSEFSLGNWKTVHSFRSYLQSNCHVQELIKGSVSECQRRDTETGLVRVKFHFGHTDFKCSLRTSKYMRLVIRVGTTCWSEVLERAGMDWERRSSKMTRLKLPEWMGLSRKRRENKVRINPWTTQKRYNKRERRNKRIHYHWGRIREVRERWEPWQEEVSMTENAAE